MEVEQVLKPLWDCGLAERDFDQDAIADNGNPQQVKFMCEPLPGLFGMFNQVVPGTFNPEVVIKLIMSIVIMDVSPILLIYLMVKNGLGSLSIPITMEVIKQ